MAQDTNRNVTKITEMAAQTAKGACSASRTRASIFTLTRVPTGGPFLTQFRKTLCLTEQQ